LVGLTSAFSAVVFGIYGTLKKKRIIPEEIDPWENDEIFDVTSDNPLYNTTGVSLQPLYVED